MSLNVMLDEKTEVPKDYFSYCVLTYTKNLFGLLGGSEGPGMLPAQIFLVCHRNRLNL